MDVDTIVPGHGPLTDKEGVKGLKDYFDNLIEETKTCFSQGLSVEEAIRRIDFSNFKDWSEPERIAINVHSMYREFRGDNSEANSIELFALMASHKTELNQKRKRWMS